MARRRGKRVQTRPDWERVRDGILKTLLEEKFKPGSVLAEKLMATDEDILKRGREETPALGTSLLQ
ncbi:hypothetical protein PSTG_19673 [Puccinia striiformis f. sp. tritici PST-78]|uniref:Uncharacterized protein n=1 Tax=Puccinia striiformis f. sp. tritici PST-78 TaxID=1165861 RepID=A0A0L0UIW6_9BASI|nr:hypothetical protein PSTG_19673 [Puccinia striiformis f. sp. tritici PST-78]